MSQAKQGEEPYKKLKVPDKEAFKEDQATDPKFNNIRYRVDLGADY